MRMTVEQNLEARGLRFKGSRLGGQGTWALECNAVTFDDMREVICSNVIEHDFPLKFPEDPIAKWFSNKGWTFTKKSVICPSCKVAPKQIKGIKKVSLVSPRVAPPATFPVKTLLAVQAALEVAYDEAAGRYKLNHSDDTVAKVTGFFPSVVQAIRVEIYGEPKEAPEIARLRRDIDDLEALIKSEIANMRVALARIVK